MTPDPGCLFCRIVAGDIPSTLVYEDEHLVAFRDIDPKAPTHVLLVPRRHVTSLAALDAGDAELAGRLLLAAADLARAEGLQGGWRVVSNVGEDAGQSVPHLHVHLLGGRALGWPPG
jgi:histidine triad (HIT) family protein